MGLKPGYKQTEVGVIPEDWDVRPLGRIGEVLIGLTYKPTDVRSDGVLVLRSSNVQESTLRFDDNVFVGMEVPERIMVRSGDILICVRNGSRDLIGKCARIDDRAVGMTFGAFMAIFRSPLHTFVYHQFQSRLIKRQIQEHLGATINQITNKSLNSFLTPLPHTKAEQDAIAEALSDADGLIESLEQLLAKKRHLKQGAMQEMLTGNKRLPGFSSEWEFKDLGQMGKCHRGVSYNPGNDLSPFDTDSTIRLLRSNNVQCAKIELSAIQFVDSGRVSSDQRLRENDILICMANGSRDLVGKAGRFLGGDSFDYTFGAFMGCFRPNVQTSDPGFVFYLFQTEQYRRHIAVLLAGSSINNLTPGNVEALAISVPSEIIEQTAIVAVLSDMDAEIAALETKLSKGRQLKTGMMQELLTGRIRLV